MAFSVPLQLLVADLPAAGRCCNCWLLFLILLAAAASLYSAATLLQRLPQLLVPPFWVLVRPEQHCSNEQIRGPQGCSRRRRSSKESKRKRFEQQQFP